MHCMNPKACYLLMGFCCAACGTGIDAETETIGAHPADTQNAHTLRLTNFCVWTGKASSEHFTLQRMELAPFSAQGTSSSFRLQPDLAFSSAGEGENL